MKLKLKGISKVVITEEKVIFQIVTDTGSLMTVSIENNQQIDAYVNSFISNLLSYLEKTEL